MALHWNLYTRRKIKVSCIEARCCCVSHFDGVTEVTPEIEVEMFLSFESEAHIVML
jgi:hypothetical protein